MDLTHALTSRLLESEPTLVIGALPPLPGGITTLRVSCDDPAATQGPLDCAQARIAEVLDEEPVLERARDRIASSLRRRLLTDTPWLPAEQRFVDACNRLALRAPGRAVLVFDAIEACSSATHEALARVFRQRLVRLPIIIVLRKDDAPLAPSLAHLVETLRDGYPGSIVIEPNQPDLEPPASRPASAPLDPAVLRVLRAAAVVGRSFEIDTVARLLDTTPEAVLEALQLARDLGVRIVDRGSGTLAMPEDTATALAASVLPSLRARWHQKIARIVGAPERHRPDSMRAAAHLASAAQPFDATLQRLEAVAQLTRAGDVARASATLEATLQTIAKLPAGAKRSALETRALVERARLRWLGVGTDPSFTLKGAFDEALAAHARLGPDPSATLLLEMVATIAGVAYDLGETGVLKRAEDVLVDAVRYLLENGAVLEAAALLNEHAALALRMGNVPGASRLLSQSRDLFEARVKEAPADEHARAELADTQHLQARLPLHGAGDLSEALLVARKAEAAYKALGLRRDVARVWETMARLEIARGDLENARAHLTAAMKIEDAAADLTGLARTTSGLAELLAKSGETKKALAMLTSSIDLNLERGSSIGLSFDARALEAIERTLGGKMDDDLREVLSRARAHLAAASAGPDARFAPAEAS